MRDVPCVAYTGANVFTVTAISSSQYLQQHGQWYTASYDYQGPSDAVNSLAITLSTQGTMLPVTPPAFKLKLEQHLLRTVNTLQECVGRFA